MTKHLSKGQALAVRYLSAAEEALLRGDWNATVEVGSQTSSEDRCVTGADGTCSVRSRHNKPQKLRVAP
jgi:hypothetical protein